MCRSAWAPRLLFIEVGRNTGRAEIRRPALLAPQDAGDENRPLPFLKRLLTWYYAPSADLVQVLIGDFRGVLGFDRHGRRFLFDFVRHGSPLLSVRHGKTNRSTHAYGRSVRQSG